MCPSSQDFLEIDYRDVNSVTIIRLGDTLLAGSAPSYQWYKDGIALPGETGQKLVLSSNGTYKVKVDAIGCDNGPFSNEITVEDKWLGIEEKGDEFISIHPNPAEEFIMIRLDQTQSPVRIRIVDFKGAVLNDMILPAQSQYVISTDHLVEGFYIVEIKLDDRVERKRLIIK